MLPWAATYVTLAAIAAGLVLVRREPTIVRGDWIFLLTSLFVLLAVVATVARGARFSSGDVIGAILVLVGGWLLQSRWWIVGAPPDVVTSTLLECAGRLCAPATSQNGECVVSVPDGVVRVRVESTGRSTRVVFLASSRHRKAQLFRRLLVKQYRSVMPPIRLGSRGGAPG